MGRTAGWMQTLKGREAMLSPGAPSHRREIERRFWQQIATGITSQKAPEVVGVSQAVGTRWFRHRGGIPLVHVETPCLQGTCRSQSAKRLGCCGPETSVYGKSLAVSGEAPQRFRGSSYATLQLVAASSRVLAHGRTMEGRTGGQQGQACQTGDQPEAARLCPRPLGRGSP